MIENTTIQEENAFSIHMNSVQFNKQDHQDLIYLNMKQSETVKEQTHEDLKTEIQNNLYTNLNDVQFFNTDQEINDDQNSQLQQISVIEKSIYGLEQSSQIDNKDESKIYIAKIPNESQFKGSKLSRISIDLDQKQIKSKFELQKSQYEGKSKKYIKNPKQLIRAINLLVNVKSFYRLLTKNTRILGKLTKDQHYLINDNSSIFQIQQGQKTLKFLNYCPKLRKILQILTKMFNCLIENMPIFQPYNLYKFLWDILQAILIVSVMFLFSLITFFQMDPEYYVNFFQAVFVVFVLDMLFTFNTGVVEKGNVIFDRKKAALTYLKKNFIMDQIALLPLFMFILDIKLQGLYSWAIYFQILMKLFVLSDIFNRLTYYLNYQKNLKNIVDLVTLVFIIACVCHVFCLFWHGLAIYEIKQGCSNTWLQVRGIQDANVFTRYVQSFYYLSVTMITVGYGDITPQTTYEILFTTVTMFVTGFFYAFSLNRIGSIIENIEMKDKSYKESMQVIHRLMREENVSQTLRVQISNYLQYLYKESNEVGKQQEKEIIDKLSKQLKYGLIQDVQGKYLKEIEFIDKLESKSKIVEIMEECLFSPGEYIFQQGDLDDSALYYIVKGSVKIIYEYQGRNQTQSLVLTQLHKSQYFGDMQFIQGSARISTAQASDFCRTYKIPREQFFNCIKQSEQDFENFQMLRESYIFKENQKLFKIKCYTCNKTDHISIKCPKTHLTFSKQTLIQKANKSNPHWERKCMQRRQQKYNSLSLNLETIESVFQFLEKDENLQDLQQIEEQMNLSQDEAYLEQQLIELQQLEYTEQQVEEQKNYEINNERIIEVEQDQEQDNDDKSQQKNNFGNNKKNIQIQIYQNDQQINQDDETGSLDDQKSVQSNYSIKGIINQFQKNKQKKLSFDKNQSRGSFLEHINQQYNLNEQIFQQTDQNSSISNFTQKSFSKAKQLNSSTKNLNEDNENQEKQVEVLNQSDDQQQHLLSYDKKKQKTLKPVSYSEIKSQKNLLKMQLISENREKNNSNSTSKENLCRISNKQLQDNKDLIFKNQQNTAEQKKSIFKRKSQSLTNLQDESDSEREQVEQQSENKNTLTPNYQIKRKQSQAQKKNSIRNSISQQFIRSQSYDESSFNQILFQSEQKKSSVLKNIPSIRETVNNQDEVQNSQNNTSISNINFSKQNINYNSQSTIKSITNYEPSNNNKDSQSLQRSQQDLKRRQSKQMTLIRQQKQQKRVSQMIHPILQQTQLTHNQNQSLKSQNKHMNQINQSNAILQNQEQFQNLIRKRQSLIQSQILNQQNYHNQNQIMYSQILQQMNNSPLIAKRRSIVYPKNMIAINQQEQNKNKNQSSMVIDNLESSKLLPEINKNRSSLQYEVHNKENSKKLSQLPLKVDINKYFQHNSNDNNHFSQIYMNLQNQNNCFNQENEIHAQLLDLSYIMLQIFDKANIFRFYYPNYNINQVIDNLNSKESQQINRKTFKKQATRRFLQTKRTLNYISANNKINERIFRNNASKEFDFNKSQI
ncbi:hypothetical protein ABPG72_017152 [Tetrahymena utriculariae]